MKVREHAKQLPKELIKDITLKSAERSLLSTHDGSHFSPKQSPEQSPEQYASDRLEEGIKWSASKGETIVSQGSKKAAKKRQRRPGESSKNEGVKMRIVLLNRVETVELKEIHKQNVKLIYELKQKKR